MVKLIVNNYVKEDSVEKYLELAKEAVKLTNANDKGCIQYELHRDTQDPLHFVMLEQWEDMAALGGHGESEHYKRIIPQMNDCCAKETTVSFIESLF